MKMRNESNSEQTVSKSDVAIVVELISERTWPLISSTIILKCLLLFFIFYPI